LEQRVLLDLWATPVEGDTCMLAGSGSFFQLEAVDEDIRRRAAEMDIHPGLPLWGSAGDETTGRAGELEIAVLGDETDLCEALAAQGLKRQYRPARLHADDFCWQFCDDELQLEFSLGRGSYATALVRELVRYKNNTESE
jgi:tRNA pseudouridine13 synthase